jgi:hypothetical protein
MFKNQSTFIDTDKTSHQDLTQEKDYTIENIPIHTMAKDLQEIENPGMKKVLYPEKPIAKIDLSELTTTQKSSPFLNPAEKTNPINEPRTKSNPDYSQINKAIQPKLNTPNAIKSPTNSNFLPIVIMMLIIIFVGTGTYYFIATRKTTSEDPANLPPSMEETATPVSENNTNTSATTNTNTPEPAQETSPNKNPEAKTAPNYFINAEKPNYININTSTVSASDIKKALEKSAQDVMTSGLKAPVEFIVVDTNNAPIRFADFASMAGLTLSPKILSLLEKDFSLFFFNDNENIGLGIKLKALNAPALKAQIAKEESLLHKELAALLPYADFAPPTTVFQKTKYKNNEIRYQNLISSQKLSIDYTFQDKNLLLATTKSTIEFILDRLILPVKTNSSYY